MQFSTLALAAMSVGSSLVAAAGTTVHVVTVASKNNTLKYFPDSVTAAKGDMVQFQFAGGNHTVTQSTFDQPCQPIAMNSANVTGFYSGFMDVPANSAMMPTYTVMVNSTTPIWVYCSQAMHCQKGMTMVINVNPTANASRTLENYAALAAKATANLPGNVVEGGAAGTNSSSSSGSSSSGGSSSGSSGSDSGSSGTSGSSTGTSTGSSTKSTSSSAANSVTPMGMGALALAGLVALL